MEKAMRRFILGIGIALTVIGIILYYLGAIKGAFLILFIIAGIIVMITGLYNWGAGTDFSNKQKYPIENAGIEYNTDMGRA